MAFKIETLQSMEDQCLATVNHDGQSLLVVIPVTPDRLGGLPDFFTAELDYHSVVRFEAGVPKNDTASGLYPTADSSIIIADGSVHNLVEVADDHVLIDLYIQKGPEFICLNSEELGGSVPQLGSRLRVWLQGLRVHPVFT